MNNILIAFRNFIEMLRRYKASALLNIIGLTIAFASFYVIMSQVWWEFGYNKKLTGSDRIYLVEVPHFAFDGKYSEMVSRPLFEAALESATAVSAGGCTNGSMDLKLWKENGDKTGYDHFTAAGRQVSLSFTDVFEFKVLSGNIKDIARPQTLAIASSLAETQDLKVGDRLWETESRPVENMAGEIVAIYEDFPENTMLGNLKCIGDLGKQNIDDFSEWSSNYFIKLAAGSRPDDFIQSFKKVVKKYFNVESMDDEEFEKFYSTELKGLNIRLSNIEDLYFEKDSILNIIPQGSKTSTMLLFALALTVIILAFINFVNFFFALIPSRIRTVNTYKVFGASKFALMLNFVVETLCLVVISLIFAAVVSHLFRYSEMVNNFSASLAFKDNISILTAVIVIAIVMALAASIYPAHYITSFSPASIVGGSFSGMKSGRRLRNVLLGVQFTVSVILIIATGFILQQRNYMLKHNLGFNTRNMMVLTTRTNGLFTFEQLKNKIEERPDVVDITAMSEPMMRKDGMNWGREINDVQVYMKAYIVRPDFLRFMGIDIVDGRDFENSDIKFPPNSIGHVIVNESFAKSLDIHTGTLNIGFMEEDEVVGICRDFNYLPLQYQSGNVVLYVMPEANLDSRDRWQLTIYVRHTPEADIGDLSDHIRNCITELDPSRQPGEIDLMSFDETLKQAYRKENELTKMVALLAVIAILIAMMGVFGIMIFETYHRRREIAIRKTLGATTGEILTMFNIQYVKIVLICFVLSVPITIYGLDRWLSSFAYRTPLYWWVFASALILMLMITISVVTVRSWHAANENPVNAIKTE